MKYGHIPDRSEHVAEDLDKRPAANLVGAATAAESIDYRGHVSPRPNQGNTSSCVGQALKTSIFGRARIMGLAIVEPSAKALYDVARLIDAPHRKLYDGGSRPRAAIVGAQQYGLVADHRWPLTDENVNELPPLDVFVAGCGAKLDAYYRIASGPGAAAQVRQALAKGYLPIFAMNVDQSYEDLSGATVYEGPTGPSLGGHMQCVVGCIDGALIVANSWGPEWADNGFGYISDAAFDRVASDTLVPTTAPAEVS